MREARPGRDDVEWPTLALLALVYLGWAIGTTWAAAAWLPLGMGLVVFCTALHSSLSHEVLHGHPFRNQRLNAALVFPALGLLVPYLRFRDTHLAHHRDEMLTDPYDDPETNYMDPSVWHGLPKWVQAVLTFNNTFPGRMLLGPLIGQIAFLRDDCRALRAGDRRVMRGWVWHIPAIGLVLAWVFYAPMPIWAYFLCCYVAMSILKIRTFLEHRAHERASSRTVVIEGRGLLPLIFLNNNLHVVHHIHPKVAWYQLPALYLSNRDHYLRRNGNYLYLSYAQAIRQYMWRAKDAVAHPLWPKE